MSMFYGSVKGGRGAATRCGHASTGLVSTCQGWNIGVESRAAYGPAGVAITVHVYGGARKALKYHAPSITVTEDGVYVDGKLVSVTPAMAAAAIAGGDDNDS